MRTRSILLLSIVSAALPLAGCGGDDTAVPQPSAMDASSAHDSGGHEAGTDASLMPDSGGPRPDAGQDSGSSSPVDAGQDAIAPTDAAQDATADAGADADADADAAPPPQQVLVTTVDPGVVPIAVTINQGTAIGEGAMNGATPSTLANVAANRNNTQTVTSATNPFAATGHVPDTAAGFCDYSGATPKRISYVTGTKFEAGGGRRARDRPAVPMAPFVLPPRLHHHQHHDRQRVRRHSRPSSGSSTGGPRTSTRRWSRPSPTTTGRPGTSCRPCSS